MALSKRFSILSFGVLFCSLTVQAAPLSPVQKGLAKATNDAVLVFDGFLKAYSGGVVQASIKATADLKNTAVPQEDTLFAIVDSYRDFIGYTYRSYNFGMLSIQNAGTALLNDAVEQSEVGFSIGDRSYLDKVELKFQALAQKRASAALAKIISYRTAAAKLKHPRGYRINVKTELFRFSTVAAPMHSDYRGTLPLIADDFVVPFMISGIRQNFTGGASPYKAFVCAAGISTLDPSVSLSATFNHGTGESAEMTVTQDDNGAFSTCAETIWRGNTQFTIIKKRNGVEVQRLRKTIGTAWIEM